MEPTLRVEINSMRVRGHHGVYPQERAVGNEFEVTAHLEYSAHDAMTDDDIGSALNYAEVCDVIREVMSEPSALLENVCGRLRTAVMERFPSVRGGMVRVAKLTPPISGLQVQSVAVTLSW